MNPDPVPSECWRCHEIKPADMFSTERSGRPSRRCKACRAKEDHARRRKPEVMARDRAARALLDQYNKGKDPLKAEEYQQKKQARMARIERNKTESRREIIRKHLLKYPERAAARRAINQGCKSGQITPLSQCRLCGEHSKTEAHHFDYSKPLEVTWLCKVCHRGFHDRKRIRKTA